MVSAREGSVALRLERFTSRKGSPLDSNPTGEKFSFAGDLVWVVGLGKEF